MVIRQRMGGYWLQSKYAAVSPNIHKYHLMSRWVHHDTASLQESTRHQGTPDGSSPSLPSVGICTYLLSVAGDQNNALYLLV